MSDWIPDQSCPACGHPFDATTTAFGEHTLRPGDVSVCVECSAILEFQLDYTQRTMTDSDVAALPQAMLTEVRRWQARTVKRRDGEP